MDSKACWRLPAFRRIREKLEINLSQIKASVSNKVMIQNNRRKGQIIPVPYAYFKSADNPHHNLLLGTFPPVLLKQIP